MTAAFDGFRSAAARVRPRAAVVLGSGLGPAADGFAPEAEVGYADVPGMVPPTVCGHRGRLAVGVWNGVPVVVGFGRVHFYEGHPWDRVTTLIRHVADFGARTLLLTNAAGGVHPKLGPGELMAIRDHIKLLDPDGYISLMRGEPGQNDPRKPSPYSPRLVALLQQLEADAGRELLAGTYAALTGPCYETPAEIVAMKHVRADAVGMSTAVEAEAAHALGLDVAGLSCITNRAAGLSDGPLSHAEVEDTARLAVGRVSELLARFLAAQ